MEILTGNNGNENNNKKKNKKLIIIGVIILLLAAGLGFLAWKSIPKGLSVEQEKEFAEMKDQYEKVGHELSEGDYKKLEKAKAKPIASVEKGKDGQEDAIKTQSQDPNEGETTTTMDDEMKSALEKLQGGLENEDGSPIQVSEASIAGAILEQYNTWNYRIANHLGWGVAEYPDDDYEPTRKYISELNNYINGGNPPEDDMMMDLGVAVQNFKQATFDGSSFDFFGQQLEINDKLKGYFAYRPQFSQIYSIYITTMEAPFDETFSDAEVLLNTDGGILFAYVVFVGDEVVLLDITP